MVEIWNDNLRDSQLLIRETILGDNSWFDPRIKFDFLNSMKLHKIIQLMSCVHGFISRFEKTPDVKISLLQTKYEVKATEHNSSLE
jgi:hypothetical protein